MPNAAQTARMSPMRCGWHSGSWQNSPTIARLITMKLIDTILTAAASISAILKAIHAHPELFFQEVPTADVVAQQLTDWGIPIPRRMGPTCLLHSSQIPRDEGKSRMP